MGPFWCYYTSAIIRNWIGKMHYVWAILKCTFQWLLSGVLHNLTFGLEAKENGGFTRRPNENNNCTFKVHQIDLLRRVIQNVISINVFMCVWLASLELNKKKRMKNKPYTHVCLLIDVKPLVCLLACLFARSLNACINIKKKTFFSLSKHFFLCCYCCRCPLLFSLVHNILLLEMGSFSFAFASNAYIFLQCWCTVHTLSACVCVCFCLSWCVWECIC